MVPGKGVLTQSRHLLRVLAEVGLERVELAGARSLPAAVDELLPGGCASGGQEYGTWSTGGAAVGNISCPDNAQTLSLVWDDPNTNILAVIKADYARPSEIYLWWQSNGASIDGSSAGATSS
jgi:hypothetical protein